MEFDGKTGRPVIDFPSLPKLPKIPAGGIRTIALILLVVIVALTSFYTVDPEEVGVVLRFGKYAGTRDPGLHFKIPLGVDVIVKVPIQRQLKAEFGFRTTEVAVRSQFRREPMEAAMLTGDLNAAMVEWVVQYRVVDPFQYLFRVRNVEITFRDLSEAVTRAVVGDRTVNEVLTVGRQEIEDLVKINLQELASQYETGIRVEQVVLQDINPPDPVKPSFNAVNQAEQERERLINEAQSEYNKVVPRAEGEARQTIQQAEGYALARVNHARGEADRFASVFAEYQKAPQVTRRRIYLETMGEILSKTGRKVILDDELEGLLPLLSLDTGARVGREGAP